MWQRLFTVSLPACMSVLLSMGVAEDVCAQAEKHQGVWIDRNLGGSYNMDAVLTRFPDVKRVYVPIYQSAPLLSGDVLKPPTEYLGREKSVYETCHRRGIQVYGVFSPFEISAKLSARIAPSWLELGIDAAFAKKPPATELSIYNDATVSALASLLDQCIKQSSIDGVVMDCGYPAGVFIGYSALTREYFLRTIGVDPIDLDYPLALPATGQAKDRAWVEKICQDRVARFETVLTKFAAVCQRNNKPHGICGSLQFYDFSLWSRGANMCDWATILEHDKDAFAVLLAPPAGRLTTQMLRGLNERVSAAKIQNRIEALVYEGTPEINTLAEFNRENPSDAVKVTFAVYKK